MTTLTREEREKILAAIGAETVLIESGDIPDDVLPQIIASRKKLIDLIAERRPKLTVVGRTG